LTKAKWYDGFVQNLVTVIQIHEGLCMFNYELQLCATRCRFALVGAKHLGGHFLGTHCSLFVCGYVSSWYVLAASAACGGCWLMISLHY